MTIKITVDRAKYLLNKKNAKIKPVKVLELSNSFVFDTVPINSNNENGMKYDSLIAVDKKDGRVHIFHPHLDGSDEYRDKVEREGFRRL